MYIIIIIIIIIMIIIIINIIIIIAIPSGMTSMHGLVGSMSCSSVRPCSAGTR
jgi:hypothetical protein